ncbi:MAG TPA: hypothetical protein VM621_11415 [Luteibacter sp.]|uniref:hypothetical protein n=1 Tax=Luteibacter sp. TaxID=1886636 RepID=UPI002C6FEF82|nr:hypothetical protein [Luteibacter sp.]HVI55640.1 hypothetical protein [Luteibacter sp.]
MSRPTPGKWLAIAGGVAMVAAVVAGLSLLGSPAHQRALRLDYQRVQNLRTLSTLIGSELDRKKALPSSLAAVGVGGNVSTDPVTGTPYHYEVTGKDSFRLYATFDAASEDEGRAPYGVGGWAHAAGPQCFTRHGQSDHDIDNADP